MQAGALVVASDIDGYNKIIRHRENGFLFAPGNTAEMVNVIREILENRNECKKVAEQAHRDSMNFSWNIIGKQYERLLNSINSKKYNPGGNE